LRRFSFQCRLPCCNDIRFSVQNRFPQSLGAQGG
jgi:hypothetical protein